MNADGPYRLQTSSLDSMPTCLTVRAILRRSWQIYRRHFLVIVAVVVAVWAPLDLLSSYMDAFVFEEDDFRKSWRFAQFLDCFFGIIATAAVISVGHEALAGQQPEFGGALRVGFRSWGRMWWTRLLTGLILLVGFLLLIFPGIYLLVRLSLVEPVAVQERTSGLTPIRRSYELTDGRFWLVFRLGLSLVSLLILLIAAFVLPTVFIPALDHWLIDAAAQLLCDVVAAFGTVAIVTTYSYLNEYASPPN